MLEYGRLTAMPNEVLGLDEALIAEQRLSSGALESAAAWGAQLARLFSGCGPA